MRFMFCKIHCPPFICFCKPSPHIYTPGPLKLENTPPPNPNPNPNPHVPSSKPDASDQLPNDPIEIKEESLAENPKPAKSSLKSNLRKPDSSDPAAPKDEMKKRVQWMDFLGKDLVEIREFECSELDDTDSEYENRRGCICVIL